MSSLDCILLILILFGAYKGWRRGVFTNAVSLIGSVVIFILAYYLKNPVAEFLYERFPFYNFGGVFSGISSFNIIIYEIVAYILCFIALLVTLKIILKVTGLVDKLLKLTIVFALPSKILGLIIGAIQYYIYAFIIVFVLSVIPFTSEYLTDSNVSKTIVASTPVLSNITKDMYYSFEDVYKVCIDYRTASSIEKDKGNYKALEIMMRYKLIDSDSVKKLKDQGKLLIENVDDLIDKYKEEDK